MDNYEVYIIQNNYYTYVGCSNNPKRRLRQHNGEIKGGAKYTLSKGEGWSHILIVSGFQNKIQALQFEWAVKHEPPRNAGGINNRIKKLVKVLCKERWTSNAPLASSVSLKIDLKDDKFLDEFTDLPEYVSIKSDYELSKTHI